MSSTVLSPDSPAWLAAVRFHGHACPGLAIGCRMALAAVLAFDLDASFLTRTDAAFRRTLSPDEEVVCVAETDACCVDAVQLLLGCTLGKGNLLLRPRGKTAMSFYHRPARLAVRILWQADIHAPDGREMSRGEKMAHFLSGPEDALLAVRAIPFAPPSRALVSRSLACANCGEMTAGHAVRLRDGQPFCLDCRPDPSRIL